MLSNSWFVMIITLTETVVLTLFSSFPTLKKLGFQASPANKKVIELK